MQRFFTLANMGRARNALQLLCARSTDRHVYRAESIDVQLKHGGREGQGRTVDAFGVNSCQELLQLVAGRTFHFTPFGCVVALNGTGAGY